MTYWQCVLHIFFIQSKSDTVRSHRQSSLLTTHQFLDRPKFKAFAHYKLHVADLTLSQTTKNRLFQTEGRQFADDNFKFNENGGSSFPKGKRRNCL